MLLARLAKLRLQYYPESTFPSAKSEHAQIFGGLVVSLRRQVASLLIPEQRSTKDDSPINNNNCNHCAGSRIVYIARPGKAEVPVDMMMIKPTGIHKYTLAPMSCLIVTILGCTVAFFVVQDGFASHGSTFHNSFVSTESLEPRLWEHGTEYYSIS